MPNRRSKLKTFSWQQIPSPIITEILCLSNCEGIVLDLEHGAFSRESIFSCIQVATNMQKQCLARIANVDTELIRICLDAGVDGLIFANLKSAEESLRIHQLCRHPSHTSGGVRGVALVRQNHWGLKDLISKDPVMIAQIESVEGIQNLDCFVRHNYDFYMLGPYDLSASCGAPGDWDNPGFQEQLLQFTNKIPESKRAAHIVHDVKKWIKKHKGYGMIALGMDTTMLLHSNREIQNVRY